MRPRLFAGSLVVLALAGLATIAIAQLPRGADDIVWSSFVAGPGRRPASVDRDGEPGTIELGDSPWRCGYGRPRHAAIRDTDWSVQRVLACQRDGATVSATASCRVHDGGLDEHAATLSLGSVGDDRHVTVTLSCRAR